MVQWIGGLLRARKERSAAQAGILVDIVNDSIVMSGLFRGALTLIQGESSSSPSHPLIGSQVEVGTIRLRVDSLIAEGGFAVVFAAYDRSSRWYALKRQLTKDQESMEAVLLEIRILKELSGHPSILQFIAAAQMKIPSGGIEFMLLTELCSGGSVADLMKNFRLTPEQALRIFHAAAMAVRHMHDRKVPITHRDIKIENLLFDASGRVKLCDFGSATTEMYAPDDTWNMAKRTQLEEEMQRHTTPMYRAPEILDTYQNFIVGPQQDIWALGCVLFYLCYHVHPFEDSAKLRILNVAYSIPSGFDDFADVLPVIESCLKVDPVTRPVAKDLVEHSEALAIAFDIDLKKPVPNVDTTLLRRAQVQRSVGAASSAVLSRPPPRSSVMPGEMSEQASAMFGAIKGQGLSLLKNLKDRSSAVVQKVQLKLVSQEVTWLTSRVCVVPVTKANFEQCEEQEWNARVAACARSFVVYNLSSRPLHASYSIEPITCPLFSVHPQLPPSVECILRVCSSVVTCLRSRPGAAVVFFGLEDHCMLISAATLIYCKLISNVNDALDFVANKRRTTRRLSPSQLCTLYLIKNVTSPSIVLLPLSRPMSLHSMSLSSLPILAGMRSGLRLVIEVFSGPSKVWDSIESSSALSISKSYSIEMEVKNVLVDGQVTLLISYSRSDPGISSSRKMLLCLVFHTSVATETMTFTRTDITVDPSEENNVPMDIRIVIGLRAASQDDRLDGDSSTHDSKVLQAGSPEVLVLDIEEHKEIMDWLKLPSETSASVDAARLAKLDGPTAPPEATEDFFQSLDWSRAQLAQQQSLEHTRTQATAQAAAATSAHSSVAPVLAAPSHPIITKNDGCSRRSNLVKDVSLPTDSPSTTTTSSRSVRWSRCMVTAEVYERQAGTGVPHVEDSDADKNKFDHEKETPILSELTPPCPVTSEFNLLDLGESSARPTPPRVDHTHSVADPFSDLISDNWTTSPVTQPSSVVDNWATCPSPQASLGVDNWTTSPPTQASAGVDVWTTSPPTQTSSGASNWATSPLTQTLSGVHAADLLDLLTATSSFSIHRNVSAPAFQPSSANFDPFAEFLSQSASSPSSAQASATNSGSTTPMPFRPNYSRTAFESISPSTTAKPKVTGDAFGELLSSQGFTASTKSATSRTLCDLRRADNIKDMDPVAIKIRDWTDGKERNIRALLGSLNDVLWEGAEKWQQPRMADLLSAVQVKKSYYKACLVVHPDKQVGAPHEKLARAIFTELNDAWNAFEQGGSKSL